jgi:maltooligosyltrehalose trehalohydrolase
VNLDHPEVRRFVLDNVSMWFDDFHVDGLRIDAVHALVDHSPTHILQEMAEETEARAAHVRRPLTLIAESDLNDPRLILPREAGGFGLTAQWSDDHHHAMHAAVTGESSGYYSDFATPDALPTTSTKGFFHDGSYSSFRERPHGFPIPTNVPTWRLVTFLQNHDQIGNRAAGDRISQSLDEDELAVAAVLMLTSPFTPVIYMGEEWGASTPWQFFTSHPEPELGRATAHGRFAEFAKMGWDESAVPDPQSRETFERSKLNWSELDQPAHARLLALHRALIRLRRRMPELTDPRFDHTRASGEGDEALGVFRLDRGAGIRSPHGGLVSVCAALRQESTFEVGAEATLELCTTPAATLVEGLLTLPARSAAVVRVRAERER